MTQNGYGLPFSTPEIGAGKGRRRIVLVAVAVVALFALPGIAGATNYQTYNDPAGDNASAPDVTTVHVSNDPAGNLTFEITLAGAPDISAAEIDVNLDSDQNSGTGDTAGEGGGIDNAIVVSQGTFNVCRWTGTECSFAIPQPANTTYTYVNGVLTFTVAPADVAVTGGFNFWVGSFMGEGQFDPAPDFGLWNYQVVAGPPKLALSKLTVAPKTAAAGKILVVSMTLTRQDSGAAVTSGNVVCKGAIAGLGAVKGAGKFANGAATCTFKIPKTAKGKTIKGTITAGYLGATLKQAFSAKIK